MREFIKVFSSKTSCSKIMHSYRDVIMLQDIGLFLTREGALSCHTDFDMGPRFIWSHSKERPVYSPLTTSQGFYPNPTGPVFLPSLPLNVTKLFIVINIMGILMVRLGPQ